MAGAVKGTGAAADTKGFTLSTVTVQCDFIGGQARSLMSVLVTYALLVDSHSVSSACGVL